MHAIEHTPQFTDLSEKSARALLAHNPWCAFEVDEVHGVFHWDSVVVHGSFTMLDPKVGSTSLYDRALDLLERFIPAP